MESFRVSVDNESGYAMSRLGILVGSGVDDHGIRHWAVGNPHFCAVQDPVIAFLIRPDFHRHDVRSGAAFGHGQSSDVLSRNQFRQILLLLRFVAISDDLVDAQVRVCTVGESNTSSDSTHFLHDKSMRKVAHVSTSVLLGSGDAVEAHFTALEPELSEILKNVGAVSFVGVRLELGLEEVSAHVSQLDLIVSQTEEDVVNGDAGQSTGWDSSFGCNSENVSQHTEKGVE